ISANLSTQFGQKGGKEPGVLWWGAPGLLILGIEAPNFEVSEPDFIVVILQHDVSRAALCKSIIVNILARDEQRIDFGRSHFELDDLLTVEPVLSLSANVADSPTIALSDRAQSLLLIRWNQIVECAGRTMPAVHRIREILDIQDLVLESQYGISWQALQRVRFGYVVFDSAIGSRRHLPLEIQLEVFEDLFGHQVCALQGLPVGSDRHIGGIQFPDRALLDNPVFGWHVIHTEPPPTRKSSTIEEQLPAGCNLRLRERVRRACAVVDNVSTR